MWSHQGWELCNLWPILVSYEAIFESMTELQICLIIQLYFCMHGENGEMKTHVKKITALKTKYIHVHTDSQLS